MIGTMKSRRRSLRVCRCEGPRATFGDLNMLVAPGGRERDAGEFEELLAAADFRLVKIIDDGITMIKAAPA
jgi:hypothetical protein